MATLGAPKLAPAKYGSLASLAKVQGCTQRTVREWCKGGMIPEAVRKKSGHWKIRRPLSEKTRIFLGRKRGDWAFTGGRDAEGDFEPDHALMLLNALQSKVPLDVFLETPYHPELEDPSQPEAERACQIESHINNKLMKGESCGGLILRGVVYQFWIAHQKFPTVAEIASLMGLSRGGFYRRGHKAKEIADAYPETPMALPDADGLASTQRANWKSKKSSSSHLHRDL